MIQDFKVRDKPGMCGGKFSESGSGRKGDEWFEIAEPTRGQLRTSGDKLDQPETYN